MDVKFLLGATLLLLAACGKPDQPTIGLYPAIHQGDLNQIQRHIKWGSDINQVDVDGRPPLHVAAEQGRYAIVKLLLKSGADIDAIDRQGHSALYTALRASRARVAELLIGQGAHFDIDQLLEQMVQAGVGNRDVIQLLARQGADMNRQDSRGETPLTAAITGGHRVLAKHLVAQGADVNLANSSGQPPLQLALSLGQSDIAQMLRRNGAEPPPGS